MSQTFSQGDSNDWISKIQRALNEIIYSKLITDGNFGEQTKHSLQDWQLFFKLTPDGIYAGKTAEILDAYINQRFLVEADYVAAASKLQVTVPMVKAVTEIEARGTGFLASGRPTALFERHIFYRELNKRINGGSDEYINTLFKNLHLEIPVSGKSKDFLKAYLLNNMSNIYYPETGGYMGTVNGVENEYKRLEKAKTIDIEAALMSASYGLFQIMGFNYKTSGFTSASEMYAECARSERNQLNAFCNFVLNDHRLIDSLRKQAMTDFAVAYNGPAQSGYDTRLLAALNKWKAKPH